MPSAQDNQIFKIDIPGKTPIGRQLAKTLGLEFVDSDHEIELRTGVAIPVIFELEGEAGFRKRERAVIDELTQQDGIVLATGGGAVLNAENRAHLKARGLVIYLCASLDKLVTRTARDRNRPLLQTTDPRQRLRELLEQRDPLYREAADIVINTDKGNVRQVVREILGQLRHDAAAHKRGARKDAR